MFQMGIDVDFIVTMSRICINTYCTIANEYGGCQDSKSLNGNDLPQNQ